MYAIFENGSKQYKVSVGDLLKVEKLNAEIGATVQFPVILTADEKGVYNYSGFFHFGFVTWQEIGGFTKEAAVLDMLDSDTPSIKISVKNFNAFKRKQSFYRKWLLFWSLGEIKIHTLCSQIPRKQLLTLLCDMLGYYSHSEQVNNG